MTHARFSDGQSFDYGSDIFVNNFASEFEDFTGKEAF